MSLHRPTIGESLARAAYSLLWRVLAPVALARAWWRGGAEPIYREAFAERWARYRESAHAATDRRLWIHSVSLGETLAASALVDALRARQPSLKLLLTQGTATGRAAGAKLLREGDLQTWLPIDTPGAVARFLDHFEPAVGVLMETEIWPNLLRAAARRNVPMVLANGRLSARSRRSGRRVAAVLRPAFESLRLALAQSDDDAARLRDSGVADVRVAGNLKFDLEPDADQMAQGRRWRASLDAHALPNAQGPLDKRPLPDARVAARSTAPKPRGVVLAAVTREGEEGLLLDAWLRIDMPRPLFVIVPRHPQRFDEVARLVEARGLSLARRSAWGDEPLLAAFDADVWLGDSMREMATWYAMADVALLGGSFEPLGGQNLIEAAACGCPVVMGPHTFNFAAAAAGALTAGAALRVADANEGVTAALTVVAEGGEGGEGGEGRPARAREFAAAHRGAAGRMADAILALWRAAPSLKESRP